MNKFCEKNLCSLYFSHNLARVQLALAVLCLNSTEPSEAEDLIMSMNKVTSFPLVQYKVTSFPLVQYKVTSFPFVPD